MKTDELRQKTIDELKKTLESQKTALEKFLLDVLQKKEKNHSKAKYMRADIARINSVISEKKILEEKK